MSMLAQRLRSLRGDDIVFAELKRITDQGGPDHTQDRGWLFPAGDAKGPQVVKIQLRAISILLHASANQIDNLPEMIRNRTYFAADQSISPKSGSCSLSARMCCQPTGRVRSMWVNVCSGRTASPGRASRQRLAARSSDEPTAV